MIGPPIDRDDYKYIYSHHHTHTDMQYPSSTDQSVQNCAPSNEHTRNQPVILVSQHDHRAKPHTHTHGQDITRPPVCQSVRPLVDLSVGLDGFVEPPPDDEV